MFRHFRFTRPVADSFALSPSAGSFRSPFTICRATGAMNCSAGGATRREVLRTKIHKLPDSGRVRSAHSTLHSDVQGYATRKRNSPALTATLWLSRLQHGGEGDPRAAHRYCQISVGILFAFERGMRGAQGIGPQCCTKVTVCPDGRCGA